MMTNLLSLHFPREFASSKSSSLFFPDSPSLYPSIFSSSDFVLSVTLSMIVISLSSAYHSSSFRQLVFKDAGQIISIDSKPPSRLATARLVVFPRPIESARIHCFLPNRNCTASFWCSISLRFGSFFVESLSYLSKSTSMFM